MCFTFQFCPLNLVGSGVGPDANKFIANLVFELPQQVGLTATASTTYKINGGLRIGDSEIWVSTRNYTVDTTVQTDVESSSMSFFLAVKKAGLFS